MKKIFPFREGFVQCTVNLLSSIISGNVSGRTKHNGLVTFSERIRTQAPIPLPNLSQSNVVLQFFLGNFGIRCTEDGPALSFVGIFNNGKSVLSSHVSKKATLYLIGWNERWWISDKTNTRVRVMGEGEIMRTGLQ